VKRNPFNAGGNDLGIYTLRNHRHIRCSELYDEPSKVKVDHMSSATGNLKDYEERIIRDRGICGGQPVFKGTRVSLRTVLASLAVGDSTEDILSDFPSLKADDVRAAIAFAAASAEEDLPVPAVPHIRSISSWTRIFLSGLQPCWRISATTFIPCMMNGSSAMRTGRFGKLRRKNRDS